LKLVFEFEPGDEAVGRSGEKTQTGIETQSIMGQPALA